MKFTILTLLVSFTQFTSASILRVETVTQPIYLHGSDTDSRISFQSVPLVTFSSDPEWRFSAISLAFIPPTDGTWKPHDINLASLYHIDVDGSYKKDNDIVVTVDASKAAKPEGYPFTVEQVLDAVVTCVKMMYPPRPVEDGTFDIVISKPSSTSKPTK